MPLPIRQQHSAQGPGATAVEFYKQERFHDAILYLQAAIKRNSKDALAYYNLGLCQLALKENGNALRSFNCAVTINKKLPEAYRKEAPAKTFWVINEAP